MDSGVVRSLSLSLSLFLCLTHTHLSVNLLAEWEELPPSGPSCHNIASSLRWGCSAQHRRCTSSYSNTYHIQNCLLNPTRAKGCWKVFVVWFVFLWKKCQFPEWLLMLSDALRKVHFNSFQKIPPVLFFHGRLISSVCIAWPLCYLNCRSGCKGLLRFCTKALFSLLWLAKNPSPHESNRLDLTVFVRTTPACSDCTNSHVHYLSIKQLSNPSWL